MDYIENQFESAFKHAFEKLPWVNVDCKGYKPPPPPPPPPPPEMDHAALASAEKAKAAERAKAKKRKGRASTILGGKTQQDDPDEPILGGQ